MKENELYRQIRSQIRAYELLKESKLPRNMLLQEEKKRLEIERDNLIKDQMDEYKIELKKKKKSTDPRNSIPNYDALYKKFIADLEAKKAQNHMKKPVQCKPFTFHTKEKMRKVNSAANTRISSASGTRTTVQKHKPDSMQRLGTLSNY